MGPVDLLYFLCVYFIRSYKWIELQFLKLFQSKVEKLWRKLGEQHGIIFHPIDKPMRQLTKEEEKKILSKCKYDHLVHLKVGKSFFVRVTNQASMGLGEGYVNGEWDFTQSPEDISEFFYRILDSSLFDLYFHPWNKFLHWVEFSAFNLQTAERAWEVGTKHYDLGNDLFKSFLDPWMQYSCGYWAKADNLNDAMLHKMDLIARKLELKPGMRVLEIGCGWGGLCKYFAENFGVSCVGITVSKEGVAYGKKICEGLDVDIRLQDYREITGEFDRVVIVEMIEHVGPWNLRSYFQVIHNCLKDDGLLLLQSFVINHKNLPSADPWMHTYIVPNFNFPNYRDLAKHTEGLFIIEDLQNIGQDYSKTVRAWRDNFIQNWGSIQSKYGERFYRMWIYYLSSGPGPFTSRKLQVWQLVLSKNGLRREYRAAR